MKISVIVPVYNIEQYLPTCVDSILAQDYQDFELILVDDGSTDCSPAICDQYCLIDSRIFVIHKPNGGPSDARNAGLTVSKGEYIYFVDGDDFIQSETLSTFINLITIDYRPDLILGRMTWFIDESEIKIVDTFDIPDEMVHGLNGQAAYVKILKHCGKIRLGARGLYRRKFLLDNNLFFAPGYYAEDMEWMIRVLVAAQSVSSNSKPHYFYRDKRPGSLVNTLSASKAEATLSVLEKWLALTKDTTLNPEFRIALLNETSKRYLSTIRKFNLSLNENERANFVASIQKKISLAKAINSKSGKTLFGLYQVVGVDLTLRLIKLVEKAIRKIKPANRYDKIG